jgi:hypothetical protein
MNQLPLFIMQFVDMPFLIQAIADVEREVMKSLEKQYMDTLMPLRDGIPKILEKHVQRLTRRQSIAPYAVPNQVYMLASYHTLCSVKLMGPRRTSE